MIVFQNSKDVLQNDLCNGCDCTGFVPKLTYVASGAAETVTITDASTFGAGDSFDNVNVWVYDKKGNEAVGSITAAAGNVVVDVSNLDLALLDIKATVVSTAGCKTDLGIYNVPSTGSGELGNKSFQGNRTQIK